MMAETSDSMYFWATCPYCPDNAHAARFPITVKIKFVQNFEMCAAYAVPSVESNPIRQHMEKLHPDQLVDSS
jgi:hypothetical protein